MRYCSRCGKQISEQLPTVCNHCETPFWKNPRCCAGAVILKDNSILLAKRAVEPWCGYWDIPGGYCEAYETPKQCAIRETYEETGIKIKNVEFWGIWNEPASNEDYGDNICIYYKAIPAEEIDGQAHDEEMNEISWFPYDNLPDKIAFPGHIPKVLALWKKEYGD